MDNRLPCWAWLLLGCCSALTAGCVERRFIVTSDPPGAIVFDWKDEPRSASPADLPFTYYGKYRFKLVKDGYETLVVEEKVNPPWYEWFLVDFFSENLTPYTFRDVRTFHYQMKPLQPVFPEVLLQSANELRGRGQAIGPPAPPAKTAGPAPSPPLMPGAQ